MTNDTGSAEPIAYQGERYLVSVETSCPIVAEPYEGVRLYGPGAIAVRTASAPSWAPSLVTVEPLEANGAYLTMGDSAPWGGAFHVVARWIIREGYRDESGRITEAGRAALYAEAV